MNGSIEYLRRDAASIKVYRDYGMHKTLFDSRDRFNYSDMVSAFEAMWAEIVSLRGQLSDEKSTTASAVATEREACARIAQDMIGASRREIAAAIRARSDTAEAQR